MKLARLLIVPWMLMVVFGPLIQAQERGTAATDLGKKFDAARKWAVVIGVNEYLDPGISKLRYCVADAKLVADVLVTRCGYDAKNVLVITDDQEKAHLRPLRINIDKQLRGWLAHAKRGDTVLVFFSGHGFLDARGQGFLVPQDMDRNNPGLTAFRTSDLRDMLRQCAATQKLLVLDCCHSGGEKGARPFGSSGQELGAAFSRAQGLVTLASCRKDETSVEWAKIGHGLFTYVLSRGLGGKADYDQNGIIDSDELYRFSVDEVPVLAQRELNAKQTPVRIIGEDVVGIMALARVSARPAEEAPPVASGPWPMFGGNVTRNMVYSGKGQLSDRFSAADASRWVWVAPTGPRTYSSPVVASGMVFIGTGNASRHAAKYAGDYGCLIAYHAGTGKFLWQLTRPKLATGRVNDWPFIGICSTPCVVGDRIWVVTNRAELLCLDVQGFRDGENDGVVTDEPDQDVRAADVVWGLDMIKQLGVWPHHASASSPVVYRDKVFVIASNGVDESLIKSPAPNAQSFLAIDKATGQVVWAARPEQPILNGQWSSPSIGKIGEQTHVYFAGGDGWVYAFDVDTGKLVWKFDGNPQDAKWELGGRGTRNSILSAPVFVDNSVIVGMGREPEHDDGVGHLYRINATLKGDVTRTGMIWHFGGEKDSEAIFGRTLSTVAVKDGLVFTADTRGFVYCIDYNTGAVVWQDDLFAAVWSSPLVVGDKVVFCDEDGTVSVYRCGRKREKLSEGNLGSSIYGTPGVGGSMLFVPTEEKLYGIRQN